MSRPAVPGNAERVTTALRINPELHAQLKAAADERCVGINLLVNRAIVEYLDRLRPVDELINTTTMEDPS